jgi:hypothetical protein
MMEVFRKEKVAECDDWWPLGVLPTFTPAFAQCVHLGKDFLVPTSL